MSRLKLFFVVNWHGLFPTFRLKVGCANGRSVMLNLHCELVFSRVTYLLRIHNTKNSVVFGVVIQIFSGNSSVVEDYRAPAAKQLPMAQTRD